MNLTTVCNGCSKPLTEDFIQMEWYEHHGASLIFHDERLFCLDCYKKILRRVNSKESVKELEGRE